jgi:hypothetical protein
VAHDRLEPRPEEAFDAADQRRALIAVDEERLWCPRMVDWTGRSNRLLRADRLRAPAGHAPLAERNVNVTTNERPPAHATGLLPGRSRESNQPMMTLT